MPPYKSDFAIIIVFRYSAAYNCGLGHNLRCGVAKVDWPIILHSK